jgi:hypothetical protein
VSPDETITADELAGTDDFGDESQVEDADARLRRRRRRDLATLAAIAAALAFIIWWILTYTVVVPNVKGLDRGEALIRLTAADLEVGDVTVVRSTRYHRGEIVMQGPVAGQRTWRGTEVDLAVSQQAIGSGAVEELVEGATDAQVAYHTSEWDEGMPLVGTQPAPRTYSTDYPGDVVPMVQALSEKKAVKELKKAGYKVKVKHGPNSSGPGAGKVFFQDPSPYSEEKRGSSVEIWVSTGGPRTGETCPVPRESE